LPEVPVAVVGNKIDLDRRVTTQEGQRFAESKPKALFYETSCMDGDGIQAVFDGICDAIVGDREERKIPFRGLIEQPLLPTEPAPRRPCKCRLCHCG
jgi:hypothetical protein